MRNQQETIRMVAKNLLALWPAPTSPAPFEVEARIDQNGYPYELTAHVKRVPCYELSEHAVTAMWSMLKCVAETGRAWDSSDEEQVCPTCGQPVGCCATEKVGG